VSQLENPVEPTPTPAPGSDAAFAPAVERTSEPATVTQPAIPVSAGPVKARGGVSNRALNLLLGGALVLAIAGIAFAVGRMTAPAQTITGASFPGGGVFNGQGQTGNGGQGRGNGQGGFVFGGGAGPTVEGTVESVSDTTLTLKTADGQTIQIALNNATTYHSQTDASASDVVTGSKVLVRLDFRRGGGPNGPNGPAASAQPDTGTPGTTADDVTVVP
jgi:hypothetical protein